MIQQLYYGNISGSEQAIQPNSQLQKAMEVMTQKEEDILNLLNDEEKELFLGFVKSQIDVNCITGADKFTMGFIIGARLMLEVMGGITV